MVTDRCWMMRMMLLLRRRRLAKRGMMICCAGSHDGIVVGCSCGLRVRMIRWMSMRRLWDCWYCWL